MVDIIRTIYLPFNQLVTLLSQLAQFFKLSCGGKKDGDPVLFIHVPGGED